MMMVGFAMSAVGVQYYAQQDLKMASALDHEQGLRATIPADTQFDQSPEPLSKTTVRKVITAKSKMNERRRYFWLDWCRTGWFRKSVALICGAATLPDIIWTDIFDTCHEFDSSRAIFTATICAYKVARIIVAAAMAAPMAYSVAVGIWSTCLNFKHDVRADEVADSSAASYNAIESGDLNSRLQGLDSQGAMLKET